MAYDFEFQGWEDLEGNVHDGPPEDDDIDNMAGAFTFYWDDDTEDAGFMWTYIDEPYGDWDDWYDLVSGILETEYGLPMA